MQITDSFGKHMLQICTERLKINSHIIYSWNINYVDINYVTLSDGCRAENLGVRFDD